MAVLQREPFYSAEMRLRVKYLKIFHSASLCMQNLQNKLNMRKKCAEMRLDMEYLEKRCPKCGKEIHVPKDVKVCICMYCGETIDFQLLKTNNPSKSELSDSKEEYCKALGCIGDLLENKEEYLNNFTKKNYSTSFEQYVQKGILILMPAERYTSISEESTEAAADEIARALVEKIKEEVKNIKTSLFRESKDRILSGYRYFLAVYTIPMILYLQYGISKILADRLIEVWCQQFPRYKIKKGNYEDIQSGFRRKGFCFITTAVCDSMDKEDDCYELVRFRCFRDTYMQLTPERKALVEEYYKIAPVIVALINTEYGTEEKYRAIWQKYLLPCLKDIEKDRLSDCEIRYIHMIEELKNEYGIK
jgi:hypothetical protein